jgi:hypothetical protein
MKCGKVRVEKEAAAWHFGPTPSSASNKLPDTWINVTLQADKFHPYVRIRKKYKFELPL